MQETRIGLIGCGGIAREHMRVYNALKHARVVAVCDLVPERAKAFATKYKVANSYSDYADLLETRDMDLVDICTPVSRHLSIACDAARLGKNVLVEKPMARTSSDCLRMINESKKHGTKICVDHNQLFYSSVSRAKSMIKDSSNLVLIETVNYGKPIHMQDWITTDQEGGFIWEMACHPAYLQLHFLGDVTEVFSVGTRGRSSAIENFVSILKTTHGVFGTMKFSTVPLEPEKSVTILGSNGQRFEINIEYDLLVEKATRRTEGQISEYVRRFYRDEKRLLGRLHYVLDFARSGRMLGILSYFRLISSYLECLQKDLPSPVNPEDGMKTIRLLECIQESIEKQQPIRF